MFSCDLESQGKPYLKLSETFISIAQPPGLMMLQKSIFKLECAQGEKGLWTKCAHVTLKVSQDQPYLNLGKTFISIFHPPGLMIL